MMKAQEIGWSGTCVMAILEHEKGEEYNRFEKEKTFSSFTQMEKYDIESYSNEGT